MAGLGVSGKVISTGNDVLGLLLPIINLDMKSREIEWNKFEQDYMQKMSLNANRHILLLKFSF